MIMKKLLIFALVIILLCLSACGSQSVENNEIDNGSESSAEISETETIAIPETTEPVRETEADTAAIIPDPEYLIVENIGEYKIVRGKESTVAVRNAAKDLVADIYMETEIMLTAATDDEEENPYEIFIGKTAREVEGYTYGELGLGSFVIKMLGSKIIIDGGSENALKNAVKYFLINLSAEGVVRMPFSGEYVFDHEGYYDSIKIDGISIDKYTVFSDLLDEKIAEDFVRDLSIAVSSDIGLEKEDKLEEYEGNYILLSDTNTDFSSHFIKIENGNIIISANYSTIDECIDYFFTTLMGYDRKEGRILVGKTVEISSGTEKIFSVEKKTPYSRDRLMKVLEDVYYSDNIIVGQHMSAYRYGETLTTERALYQENLGVDCPLFGFDIAEAQTGTKYTWNAQVKDAYDMIEYAREGGIFTFSVHFPNPSGRSKGLAAYRGELGDGTAAAWEQLLTEGTEYNKNFMKTLEGVGDFLMIFHNNQVPVIFRPLHEMNGNWFWFCIVNGEKNNVIPREYAVRLWIMIYDYLVKERGIDSMIWEYSPNVAEKATATKVDVMYCYPGDEYCDIVGCDWYTGSYTGHNSLAVSEKAISKTGKIFSVTEFGPSDSIRTNLALDPNFKFTCLHLDDLITEVTEAGIKTCYWLLWSSWNEVKISMWNMGDGMAFYGNNVYLTLEDTYNLLYD